MSRSTEVVADSGEEQLEEEAVPSAQDDVAGRLLSMVVLVELCFGRWFLCGILAALHVWLGTDETDL